MGGANTLAHCEGVWLAHCLRGASEHFLLYTSLHFSIVMWSTAYVSVGAAASTNCCTCVCGVCYIVCMSVTLCVCGVCYIVCMSVTLCVCVCVEYVTLCVCL